MLEKAEGIVIKTQDYGETHKIITLFSQRLGLFSGIAHGAKKPKSRMAAVTQPFIHGNYLVYVRSGLSTIRQGEIVHPFRKIREDIIKTAYAAFISELTDKLLDTRKPDLFIYEQFHRTMQWIEEKDKYEIPVMMYELKLYDRAGISPIVNQCVSCGRTKNLMAFTIDHGGTLCQDCFKKHHEAIFLSQPVARLLHIFSEVGIERIGNISVKKENKKRLRQLLDAYYEQYGGYFLKSRNFLNQMDILKDQ